MSSAERKELVERARSRVGRAEDARRARLILMLSSGKSYSEIVQPLACNRSYVSRWKERFLSERLGGLYARHRGRAVAKRTPVPPLELPPETIEALAEAWAQLLLADLARRPPESSSGRAEAHP